MKEDVAVVQHMDVVVARVTALRSCGLVRPEHFALGVGYCEDVFALGGTYEHEAFGLS